MEERKILSDPTELPVAFRSPTSPTAGPSIQHKKVMVGPYLLKKVSGVGRTGIYYGALDSR